MNVSRSHIPLTAYINPGPVHVADLYSVSMSEEILFVGKVTYMLDMKCVELVTLEPCTYHCMCETSGLYNSGYISQGWHREGSLCFIVLLLVSLIDN